MSEIPCIFPQIREFDRRDAFAAASQHSHLVAHFLALAPDFTKASRRSPKLRHLMAVIFSELTLERELRRKNAAFLPVYLYRPFPGVTLADRQDGLHHRSCIPRRVQRSLCPEQVTQCRHW